MTPNEICIFLDKIILAERCTFLDDIEEAAERFFDDKFEQEMFLFTVKMNNRGLLWLYREYGTDSRFCGAIAYALSKNIC